MPWASLRAHPRGENPEGGRGEENNPGEEEPEGWRRGAGGEALQKAARQGAELLQGTRPGAAVPEGWQGQDKNSEHPRELRWRCPGQGSSRSCIYCCCLLSPWQPPQCEFSVSLAERIPGRFLIMWGFCKPEGGGEEATG